MDTQPKRTWLLALLLYLVVLLYLYGSWLFPIALYSGFAHGLVRTSNKYVSGKHSRTKRVLLNFSFAALFMTTYAALSGQFKVDAMSGIVFVIGFFNAFGAYCQWKATDVSLSKTSLFTFGDDVYAMGLSYVILREGVYLNLVSGGGIALAVTSAIALAIHAYKRGESIALYVYVGIYSVIWGFAMFSQRYFAVDAMPVGQFVSSWYIGAVVGALVLVLFYKDSADKSQQGIHTLRFRDIVEMFFYGAGISLSLAIAYWAYSLAPQMIVQPIFMVSEALIPFAIGWWFFKEKNTFDKKERVYALTGLFGIALIAVGFSLR